MVKYISAVLRFHGILSCCIHRSVFNIGLFLTTYAVIGIHRVIFVMEIRTSSIDECNFRICTAVSVFWLNSMRYCGFCTFFCAVLRLSDPLYAPLYFRNVFYIVMCLDDHFIAQNFMGHIFLFLYNVFCTFLIIPIFII